MNYSEIVSLAISYADRPNDSEVSTAIDGMLRIVEARVNRGLLVMASSSRTIVPITDATKEYYDLPSGFSSLRSIKIATSTGIDALRTTLEYVAPGKMNEIATLNTFGHWYVIEANKIWIHSDKLVVGNYIEYVNYADITPISSTSTTNWLATLYPDCYINGLVAEICRFAKDWDSNARYDAAFLKSIEEIDLQDDRMTWSGGSLFTQVG